MSDSYIEQFERACDQYDKKEFQLAKNLFEDLLSERLDQSKRRDCLVNIASCSASLGHFKDASERYANLQLDGKDIRYNSTLCKYKLSNYSEALELIDDLLSHDRKEFSQDSFWIECLNLRSAILFKLHNDPDKSLQCLNESRPSDWPDQDLVLKHNRSIYEHQMSMRSSIDELSRLVELTAVSGDERIGVPHEAVRNLLVLDLMVGDFSLANKLLERHKTGLKASVRVGELFELYEILADRSVSNDRSTCTRLQLLLDNLLDKFAQTTVADHLNRQLYEDLIALVTRQTSVILWENNQYTMLERLLLKVKPVMVAESNSSWLIWFAHTLFMQDTRFEECCQLYEKLLPPAADSLLSIEPVVLGNLCVAYLLTARNDAAESLIKEIELEEEARRLQAITTTDKVSRLSHSCIVNLMIGTLYCVKLNYNFGLMRVFKSIEPFEELLNGETWHVCKKCILSLLDNHCKSMIFIRDDLFEQIVSFLIECERHGVLVRVAEDYEIAADVKERLGPREKSILMGRNSVTYEARYLRSLVLKVLHD